MPKKIITTLKSFEEVDAALLKLAGFETRIQHEEAVMNDLIQKARDAFDKSTAEVRGKHAAVSQDIEAFCIEHKDEFEKPRTKELVHGSVGFKMAPPSVRLLNRKYNWETVVELLRRLRLTTFLRPAVSVDKEKILAASAAKEITDERLAACGLKIDQNEDFNIAIKWESIGE